MGMVPVALEEEEDEGNVLVPLENHFSVAADLEAGTCAGNVMDVTRDQSVEELVETMTFAKKKSKEPQAVGRINEVTACE